MGAWAKFQLLDVFLNKPFVGICRTKWIEYLQQEVAQLEVGEKVKPSSKQQVIDWVVQSNNHISQKEDMIKKPFILEYLIL